MSTLPSFKGVFVNLTPHPINVVGDDGRIVRTIPPSGQALRLSESVAPIGDIEGIPLVWKTLDRAAELPQRMSGVYYIVSLAAAQVARRPDFLVPDDLVRDDEGKVIGCRRFATIW